MFQEQINDVAPEALESQVVWPLRDGVSLTPLVFKGGDVKTSITCENRWLSMTFKDLKYQSKFPCSKGRVSTVPNIIQRWKDYEGLLKFPLPEKRIDWKNVSVRRLIRPSSKNRFAIKLQKIEKVDCWPVPKIQPEVSSEAKSRRIQGERHLYLEAGDGGSRFSVWIAMLLSSKTLKMKVVCVIEGFHCECEGLLTLCFYTIETLLWWRYVARVNLTCH